MIDALLGEEGEEGKEEMLHCSLDSIDRLGDSLTQFEKARWKAGRCCNLSYPGCRWITEQSRVFSHSCKSVSPIIPNTPFHQSEGKIAERD